MRLETKRSQVKIMTYAATHVERRNFLLYIEGWWKGPITIAIAIPIAIAIAMITITTRTLIGTARVKARQKLNQSRY